MKKLLTTVTSWIVVCIVFSSCSSNISIVKRHYKKGYYIEFAKRTQTAHPLKNEEKKTVQAKRKFPQNSIAYSSKYNTIDEYFNQDTKTGEIATVARDEKLQRKIILQQTARQLLKQTVNITENPVLQTRQAWSEASEYYDHSSDRAALSLLWIIILVILILWLIGILAGRFGLGGFINILLVIALILLILWLLRIA